MSMLVNRTKWNKLWFSWRMMLQLFITAALFFALASSIYSEDDSMNSIAESYVRLALAMGQQDPDYVDAYYGPEKWKEESAKQKKSLNEIKNEAASLLSRLEKVPEDSGEPQQLRHRYLKKQLIALVTRARILQHEKLAFDEECSGLFDAVAPDYPESSFEKALKEIDARLPGEGPLPKRYAAFKTDLIIPPDKVDSVFQAAIREARKRTLQHIRLPESEDFKIEYVKNEPWSGYNWYQGKYQSLIQINTDLPIYIDRAIDLACHEGYPGHHVYNVLLEKRLVQERGWIEFTVYPLFSPQSLIAEGSANYGIDVAFPDDEKLRFERDVLFPLAGLDPTKVETYFKIRKLTALLSHAGNHAARLYLDGKIEREEVVKLLEKYSLMEKERAVQRASFIDRYRSYVINYNLGEDMVRKYVELRAGGDPEKRWSEFERLLSLPFVPSDLQ